MVTEKEAFRQKLIALREMGEEKLKEWIIRNIRLKRGRCCRGCLHYYPTAFEGYGWCRRHDKLVSESDFCKSFSQGYI